MFLWFLLENKISPSPGIVISTGGVIGLRPPKVMKKRLLSEPLSHGSVALTLVISTDAQRSGEICGFFSRSRR
jgi:hypothetical protein